LEELNEVPGWVVDNNLRAADAGDDVVPKVNSRLAKSFDRGREIGDFDREPVPAARRGHCAIGHGLSAPGPAPRPAKYQPQITA
jgi:hypothetical protein